MSEEIEFGSQLETITSHGSIKDSISLSLKTTLVGKPEHENEVLKCLLHGL